MRVHCIKVEADAYASDGPEIWGCTFYLVYSHGTPTDGTFRPIGKQCHQIRLVPRWRL